MVPSYDEDADAVLFPFLLGDEAHDAFQFTVHGSQINLVSMTCTRAAPEQPTATPVPHHTGPSPVTPTPLPVDSPDATTDATTGDDAIVLTPTGPAVQPQDRGQNPQAAPSDTDTASQGVPVGLSVTLLLLAVVLLVVHRKTPGGLGAAVKQLLGGEKEAQSRLARDVEELDPEDMEEGDGEDEDNFNQRNERPRRARRGKL